MRWYCVHSKPLSEEAAVRYCQNKLGLETYAPKLRQQKRIRRVQREVTTPLFPRYFFCRMAEEVHYRAVRYGPDVVDFVRMGNELIVVHDRVIADLRDWAGVVFDWAGLPHHRSLCSGDTVVINSGPFMGLEAVVSAEMPGQQRVEVLLSVLNGNTRATLPRQQLDRAG